MKSSGQMNLYEELRAEWDGLTLAVKELEDHLLVRGWRRTNGRDETIFEYQRPFDLAAAQRLAVERGERELGRAAPADLTWRKFKG